MVNNWLEFALALSGFFLSHSLPVRPKVRRQLSTYLGERGFTLAYSFLSLTMLGWLIVAAGRAPYAGIWPFSPWQLWVPNGAMPAAVLVASLAVATPNPLSFGGRDNDRFDPDSPGIAGLSRHPLLLAFAIWSAAHLVPNGNLAHAIVFGGFLAFSVGGMAIIDRRKRRLMGEAEWSRLARNTGWLRPSALFRIAAPLSAGSVLRRVLAGIAAYVALLHLHTTVIGVSPWPV